MSDMKAQQLGTIQRRVNERLRNSPYHRLIFKTEEFAVLFAAFMEEFQKMQAEIAAQGQPTGRRS